jgi:hypothetical protein
MKCSTLQVGSVEDTDAENDHTIWPFGLWSSSISILACCSIKMASAELFFIQLFSQLVKPELGVSAMRLLLEPRNLLCTYLVCKPI